MSTQGSVTITLNVITKDLARYALITQLLQIHVFGFNLDVNFSGLDMKQQICVAPTKRLVHRQNIARIANAVQCHS